MEVTLIILGLLAVIAALSGGVALGLHLFLPRWSQKKRITWAASMAAIVPMLLPFAGFLLEGADYTMDGTQDFVLALLALLTLTVVLAGVVCLPTAWFVTSKLSANNEEARPKLETTDDQPKLSGAKG